MDLYDSLSGSCGVAVLDHRLELELVLPFVGLVIGGVPFVRTTGRISCTTGVVISTPSGTEKAK